MKKHYFFSDSVKMQIRLIFKYTSRQRSKIYIYHNVLNLMKRKKS